MKAIKTTYKVDGCIEPCWMVGDGDIQVRIAKFYHYIGKNTLIVSEIWHENGKEFNNGSEEIDGDFDTLSAADAVKIARKFSVYI